MATAVPPAVDCATAGLLAASAALVPVPQPSAPEKMMPDDLYLSRPRRDLTWH